MECPVEEEEALVNLNIFIMLNSSYSYSKVFTLSIGDYKVIFN